MKRHQLFAIAALPLVLSTCASLPTTAGIAPFSTDGCSRFPDRAPLGGQDWCHCCLVHDLAYWRGGSAEDRLRADENLRTCVEQKTGNAALANVMFLGVRAGGGPELATDYRWGYGWPYGRGYNALSENERATVSRLEQAYVAANAALACPVK